MRIVWLLVLALGCPQSHELVVTPTPDAAVDAPLVELPDGNLPPSEPVPCGRPLDVLLVIDDTPDSVGVQRRLARDLPVFLDRLASERAFDDVHVAVVSPDLGSGIYEVGSCRMGFGHDGVLGAGREGVCASAEPWSTLPGSSFEALRCLPELGTDGCGWEQPLEAALKAMTSSRDSLRFAAGTTGHADGANAGFFRPGAKLAVIVATNEDDCSARDPEAFDPFSPRYSESLPTRCWRREADALHSAHRYVDGLLRGRSARDVVFLALAGVPLDADSLPAAEQLGHPEMRIRLNDVTPDRPMPSCVDDEVEAYPARRFVTVADGLVRRGARARVRSACRDSYAPALDDLVEDLTEDCR
ncbi:MAG: hypothetical protein H6721_08015 [Sandaracinus sp.]|nr:hypothetical protein [Sandaracinus sp.]MCB9613742.1 hypothetical protein [Sandaracinus sp.]MCB9632064.1 hypothetical protein [Sandaracinus sp.]